MKKPFYKRWYVWLAGVVALSVVAAPLLPKEDAALDTSPPPIQIDVAAPTTEGIVLADVTTKGQPPSTENTTQPATKTPPTEPPTTTTKPVTTEPATTKPITTEPVTTQPSTTQPAPSTQPTSPPPTTKPPAPTTTQPSTTQPTTTQPATTQPASTTKPSTTQPTTTESSELIYDEVWLSATGEKYHAINNCGRMNPDKARKVLLKDIRESYKPCEKCFP